MRISDWTSDVCSADLTEGLEIVVVHAGESFLVYPFHRRLVGVAIAPLGYEILRRIVVEKSVDVVIDFLLIALPAGEQGVAADPGGKPFFGVALHGDGMAFGLHGHGRLVPCRSEEPTSELQSLMHISSAVFCLK